VVAVADQGQKVQGEQTLQVVMVGLEQLHLLAEHL
jgi:hypothetical protein